MSDEQPLPNRRESDPVLLQVLQGQKEILDAIKDISRAFPKDEFGEPDYDGHRRAHQAMIESAQSSAESRRDAVKNVRNAVLLGGGTITLTAVWEYIKNHVK